MKYLLKDMRYLMWPFLVSAAILWGMTYGFMTYDTTGQALVYQAGWLVAITFGPVLVCGELRGKLEMFWRSRPVNLLGWLASKYFVGVAAMAVLFGVTLWRGLGLENSYDCAQIWSMLTVYSVGLVLVYSLGFLFAVLVRKMVHAGILAIAGLIFVLFGPMVFPVLEPVGVLGLGEKWVYSRVSVVDETRMGNAPYGDIIKSEKDFYKMAGDGKVFFRMERSRYGSGNTPERRLGIHLWGGKALMIDYSRANLVFGGWMVLACGVCFFGAYVLMRKHWVVDVEQKHLVWAMGLVGIAIYSTVSLEIGSNLKELSAEKLPLNVDRNFIYNGITASLKDGDELFLLGNSEYASNQDVTKELFYYRVEGDAVRLDKVMRIEGEFLMGTSMSSYGTSSFVRSAVDPEVFWVLLNQYQVLDGGINRRDLMLYTLRVDTEAGTAKVELSQLAERYESTDNSMPGGQAIYGVRDRLYEYVFGKVKILDVSDPVRPKMVREFEWGGPSYGYWDGQHPFRMVPDEALSKEEQVEVSVGLSSHGYYVLDEERMAYVTRDFVSLMAFDTYLDWRQGAEVSIPLASYRRVGSWLPGAIEQWCDEYPRKVVVRGDLIYVQVEGEIGKGVRVYQYEDGVIRRVGFYKPAMPWLHTFYVLENGNVLTVGPRLNVAELSDK